MYIYSISSNTYRPTTSNQYIYSGNYLSGNQTIQGDSNLKSSNIKSGVTIFGVYGSYTGSGSSSGGGSTGTGTPVKRTLISSSTVLPWTSTTTYTGTVSKSWSYSGTCTEFYMNFSLFYCPNGWSTQDKTNSYTAQGKRTVSGSTISDPQWLMHNTRDRGSMSASNGTLSFLFTTGDDYDHYWSDVTATLTVYSLYIYTIS